MVRCGIERYDELPARVGIVDVDYCRFRLRELCRIIGKLEECCVKDNKVDKNG